MKLLSSHFVAPVTLAALSFLMGCGSDNPGTPGGAGASSAGASSAGASSAGASSAGASSAGASSAGASSAGASSAGPDGAAFTAVKNLISTSCFGNGCHSQEGNPLKMEIDDMLYGKLTTHVTKTCGKLINTASPADSAIIKLLKADCNGTMRMPYQSCWDGDPQDQAPCVSSANLAALQAWIASGAPRQ